MSSSSSAPLGAPPIDADEFKSGGEQRKLLLGICVMEKKARAKPMTRLLERLSTYAEFEIQHFGNECILERAVADWPVVDVLIAFYSDGYPLAKVRAHAVSFLVWCHARVRRDQTKTLYANLHRRLTRDCTS